MFVHRSNEPDLLNRLRCAPGLIPPAVQDFPRRYSPYRGMAGTAREDMVLGGQLIRKDNPIAPVCTSRPTATSASFPDGELFVIARHMSFGRGTHRRPGAPPAA
jgi:cytochrome P450